MIKPSIGRKVWFWRSREHHDLCLAKNFDFDLISLGNQPEDATIIGVWNSATVNLLVLDHYGNSRPKTSVPLLQEEDPAFEVGSFATWMPYQIGQAKAVK